MITCLIQTKTVKCKIKNDLKKTIEILLNELFVLEDQETNEEIIQQYANRRNIIKQ